jgi:hypothetical protein
MSLWVIKATHSKLIVLATLIPDTSDIEFLNINFETISHLFETSLKNLHFLSRLEFSMSSIEPNFNYIMIGSQMHLIDIPGGSLFLSVYFTWSLLTHSSYSILFNMTILSHYCLIIFFASSLSSFHSIMNITASFHYRSPFLKFYNASGGESFF